MGGWTSFIDETSQTRITPILVGEMIEHLKVFQDKYNAWQTREGLKIVIGNPAGSTTYYVRDMWQGPLLEYGDIDVNVGITRNPHVSDAEQFNNYRWALIDFCNSTDGVYRTENGINVIFRSISGAVQIDFMLFYHENHAWLKVLAPEHRIKGIVSTSITSAFAKALNLSFGAHGIQIKVRNGRPVPFTQRKDVTLETITNDPYNWGQDVYQFFCELQTGEPSWHMIAPHGFGDEQRCIDLVNVIGAVAWGLENKEVFGYGALTEYDNANELIITTLRIFNEKIEAAVNHPKYDKAPDDHMKGNAEMTKWKLLHWGCEVGVMFENLLVKS